jgi:hypothetical protein
MARSIIREEVGNTNPEDDEDCGAKHVGGTFHYAFIYSTIVLFALLIALQFEPLVGYRYPVLALVAAVILLFIGSILTDSKQIEEKRSPKQTLLITLIIILATCLFLILLVDSEHPVLTLVIPLTAGILIQEWFRGRCSVHCESM